ncbi:hypothetical protein LX32DRAFT_68664 [Colletotrichum zoysiae]|uniref:Uncharacterized protein n=1 Tax=Colletotrichum zoysiae TaxID=1216348 RepID=A0AAD9HBN7_9PEZI|nr:hypothetical protein LX32DRAFT_68664 [Colletotrichum zoysiae]
MNTHNTHTRTHTWSNQNRDCQRTPSVIIISHRVINAGPNRKCLSLVCISLQLPAVHPCTLLGIYLNFSRLSEYEPGVPCHGQVRVPGQVHPERKRSSGFFSILTACLGARRSKTLRVAVSIRKKPVRGKGPLFDASPRNSPKVLVRTFLCCCYVARGSYCGLRCTGIRISRAGNLLGGGGGRHRQ